MSWEKLYAQIGTLDGWKDPHADLPSSPTKLPFDRLAAAKRGYVNLNELRQIAEVKSPRRAGLVEANSDSEVCEITRLAFDKTTIQNEEERICLLCALHGVRVPTASAILAWVYPEKWGVIDRRAWQSLARLGLVNGKAATRLAPKHWAKYCDLIIPCAEKLDCTPQMVDRWLFFKDKLWNEEGAA